jgi:hypothetical protein
MQQNTYLEAEALIKRMQMIVDGIELYSHLRIGMGADINEMIEPLFKAYKESAIAILHAELQDAKQEFEAL